MAETEIELDIVHRDPSAAPIEDADTRELRGDAPRQEFSLPPADKGKDAWLFLAACWAVEAVIWGFGSSFGVFQNFYNTHEPFVGANNIAVIGTSGLGTMYLGTPLVIALCRLYPRQARWCTQAGLFFAALSIALSSFCDTVPQLVVTQGILFGVGGCFAYCPCVLYTDEWFIQRKGMAYGIIWSATGFGGAVLPLLLENLLSSHGFRTTMRIWAGVLFGISFPLAYFVKPRVPFSAAVRARPFDMSYVKTRLFGLHQLANIIQATGYYLPSIYLPSYAGSEFGASTFESALTVILVNIAATIGSVVAGSLTDKLHATTCIAISAAGATVGVFLIWGLSSSLAALYVFCVMYGLFAGCWASIWPGIMREVTRRGEAKGQFVDSSMVFGWLCVGRGLGNVISGPLSDSLLKGGIPWVGHLNAGFGSGYGALIVYTGATAFLAGSSFVWKHAGLL
ncbi:major facilitator superfamily domain-containing protein [Xylariales sp. PMI_506]|nr:major facilitator superfamily domain-containing protein [Xylariales sp. PMI_506]